MYLSIPESKKTGFTWSLFSLSGSSPTTIVNIHSTSVHAITNVEPLLYKSKASLVTAIFREEYFHD